MNKSQADKYFFFRKTDNFSNRTTDKHYHSGYEIYFLTDGKCCRFVGDRFYDIDGAKATELDSAGALFGLGEVEELTEAGATYLLNDPLELVEF